MTLLPSLLYVFRKLQTVLIMDLNCPKCKSENTQKITSVVSAGTTHTTGSTSSTSIGTTGTAVGVSTSRGTVNATSTTVLAKKLAEPTKKYDGFLAILVCLSPFVFFLSVAIGGFIAFEILWFRYNPYASFQLVPMIFSGLIFIWIMKFIYRKWEPYRKARKEYNENEFPEIHKKWSEGFYCHRCEHTFVPEISR